MRIAEELVHLWVFLGALLEGNVPVALGTGLWELVLVAR